jgi:hypothetical protein
MVSESKNLTIKFKASDVSDTFDKIHKYLSGISNPLLMNIENKIRLGDYVDLPGSFEVHGYPTDDTAGGKIERGSLETRSDSLRLMVVGRNSFNAQGLYKGSGGMELGGPDPVIPHIVMQFKDVPVNRRMEVTSTNENGYLGSEMRKYLVKVTTDINEGTFSAGLEAAGVPLSNDDIIWAPKRYVADKGSGASKTDMIEDKIWLPTEREMFNTNIRSNGNYEKVQNQAWLEYYDSNDKRKKPSGNFSGYYWEASPHSGRSDTFCLVDYAGVANLNIATYELGVAPAFCVK